VAEVTNKKPDQVIISFGDVHIYDGHVDAVKTQLEREILPAPKLNIKKKFEFNDVDTETDTSNRRRLDRDDVKNSKLDKMLHYLENLSYDDLKLVDYKCGARIAAPMYA
jgi:thymidylate synthase